MENQRIEHAISPAYVQHIAEVRRVLGENQNAQLILEGRIRQLETERVMMQKHLSTLLGLIEKAEHLPESAIPYQLSEDGLKMIGQAAAEQKVNGHAVA